VITLPGNTTDRPIVYTVRVGYKLQGPKLPVVRKLSQQIVSFKTKYRAQDYPVALPPHKTSWSFPVILMPGEPTVRLQASTVGLATVNTVRLKTASYRQLPVIEQNLKPFENNFCAISKERDRKTEGKNVWYRDRYPWYCDYKHFQITRY